MERTYVMVGKRFQAENVRSLNSQLSQYKLITNLNADGIGMMSVRRIIEPRPTNRYIMVPSYGDPADIDGFDVIIGQKIVGIITQEEITLFNNLSDLENALNSVRVDIPDASIIIGSYWL